MQLSPSLSFLSDGDGGGPLLIKLLQLDHKMDGWKEGASDSGGPDQEPGLLARSLESVAK